MVLLPAFGGVLCWLLDSRVSRSKLSTLDLMVTLGTMIAAIFYAFKYQLGWDSQTSYYFSWFQFGQLEVAFEFSLDAISCSLVLGMCLLAAGSQLAKAAFFSASRVDQDSPGSSNILLAALIFIVLSNNLLLAAVGLEVVGIILGLRFVRFDCEKHEHQKWQKNLVVNGLADLVILAGVLLVYTYFGTLSLSKIRSFCLSENFIRSYEGQEVAVIAWTFFIGSLLKAGVFSRNIWMYQKNEQSIDVSSAICSIVLGSAGVYLMLRLNFLLFLVPNAAKIMCVLGIMIAIRSALLSLKERDFFGVMFRFSNGEIGFVFLSFGVGASVQGALHLFVQACSCVLGVVGLACYSQWAHSAKGETGSLYPSKYSFLWYFPFRFAVLSLIGLPGLSGFFTRLSVLEGIVVFPDVGWTFAGIVVICSTIAAFSLLRLVLPMLSFPQDTCPPNKTSGRINIGLAIVSIAWLLIFCLSLSATTLPRVAYESIGANFSLLEHLKQSTSLPSDLLFFLV